MLLSKQQQAHAHFSQSCNNVCVCVFNKDALFETKTPLQKYDAHSLIQQCMQVNKLLKCMVHYRNDEMLYSIPTRVQLGSPLA